MSSQSIMKKLLESGVHFGHQTRRWNPKMKKFIFGQRNGIYIIDLQKTAIELAKAKEVVKTIVAQGGKVLFVGTKKQAQAVVKEEADRCNSFYVNERWLGGMLTNFSTIKQSVKRLKTIEKMQDDGTFEDLTKKERAMLSKELGKLRRNLSGIVDMPSLPQALWVIDSKKEEIAIKEAIKLGIPVVAIVDTNTDPDIVDYPIPGNDDAIRSIKYISSVIADAVIEGNEIYMAHNPEEALEQLADQAPDTFDKVFEKELEEETEAAEKKVIKPKEDRNLDAKRKRHSSRDE